MSSLVFGKSGQLAQELARRLPGARFLGRDQADLADPDQVAAAIAAHGPDLIINAAAYTAVDRAEEEEALATRVNGESPAVMARAAAALGIPFLHVSTDYVFDGAGSAAFAPGDKTGPIGAYGRSKRVGEEAIAAAGGDYAILRTSWVFSAHGGNFVKTMLRLAETRDALNVVDDQVGGPTAAGDIAAALVTMADAFRAGDGHRDRNGAAGIYHFAGAPDVSWADFAREIFAQAGRDVAVTGIPSADYPTPAARPLNSRLDCSRLEQVFGVKRPDWRVSLGRVLEELGARAG